MRHLKNTTICFLLIIFVGFLTNSCSSSVKKEDCERFRVGKFRLDSKIDNTYWIIERTDSFQIETGSKSGETHKFKVNWTNPCEYELINEADSVTAGDSLISIIRKLTTKTKIINTGKDYYVFEVQKEGVPMKYSDTIRVVSKD